MNQIVQKSAKTETVRKIVLNHAHAECKKLQGSLYLTCHFIERVNLRSNDQDRTFYFFAKCFTHLLKNYEALMGKYVEYKSQTETIVFRVNGPDALSFTSLKLEAADTKFQFAVVTYWHNVADTQHTKNHGASDVIYRINK